MKIKTFFKNYAHIFVAILIIIQPIMDVTSFWIVKLGYSNAITTILRLLIFLLTVLYGFVVSNKKNIYYLAIVTIISLYTGHFLACNDFGFTDIIGDFSNYTRIIVMPLSTIALISIVKCNDKSFDYLKKSLGIVFIIMVGVQLLSTLTGTDPHTYKDGAGILGWFGWTSSQSANLTTLAPFFILLILSRKKIKTISFIFLSILSCLSMYFLSTRLAYVGIITITLGIGICLIILNRKIKKESIILISLSIIFCLLIPVSPMMKHQNSYNSIQDTRQETLNSFITDDINDVKKLIAKELDCSKEDSSKNKLNKKEDHERLVKALTPVYEAYIGDFVQIFGGEETMKIYNYSTDIRSFSTIRPKKLMYAKLIMQNSPKSSKWFGVELSRFYYKTNNYDVENDFHGIYYLFGRIGLILCISFLGYFIYLIIYAIFKDIKKYFTLDAIICGIALVNNVAHIYNTAGVLRRQNASIYLAALLTLIYYLVKVKNYDKGDQI